MLCFSSTQDALENMKERIKKAKLERWQAISVKRHIADRELLMKFGLNHLDIYQ